MIPCKEKGTIESNIASLDPSTLLSSDMLTDLALHGVDNYVGLDWELLTKLNPVLQGNFGIHLSPNTEYQLVLPFDLQKAFFGSDTWRHLDKYSMYLHMTSFPMEKDIEVQ